MNAQLPWTTTFNTVSVTVACPVPGAWNLFLDRAAWQPSFVAREVIRGSDPTAGTLALVRSVTNDVPNERFEEYVHVEFERRIIVRIWADAMTIVTHADFAFEPVVAGCRVTASIHCWLKDDAAAGADRLRVLTQNKINEDFNRLKTVAEGRMSKT